ncbi:multiple stress resistance protein BhsA [Ewingella sp. AOP8-B2-18]
MKNVTKALAVIVLTAASFATIAATEVNAVPVKEQSIGVINASAVGTNLSDLQDKLAAKANEHGATSYRIISADGDNYLHGTAEIYK